MTRSSDGDGLTVVVPPLIALMKDQVDAFNRRGLGRAPIWLSVVSAELRAGATDQTGRRAVRELVDQFDRVGRLVTPDA